LIDPWQTTADVRVEVGGLSVSPTLYHRAEQRVDKGSVRRSGAWEWLVYGDTKLGDTYPSYPVTLRGTAYECGCYSTDHGEHRRKRKCSHVIAVMIFRERLTNGQEAKGAGENGRVKVETSEPEAIQTAGPAPAETRPGKVREDEGTSPALTLVALPEPTNPLFRDTYPLPSWVEEIRAVQWDAVQEVLELYRSGCEIVWVDAPTGSGKTLIGELVRRALRAHGIYICHSKTLQDQMLHDFPYAKVLKGRANYPTQGAPWPEVTCADCTMAPGSDDCSWCDDVFSCAYQTAKRDALLGKLAVLNTAYFFAESNYVGQLAKGRGLHIVDECDVLERELMGFVEFSVGERLLKSLGLSAPKKGAHKTTIGEWLVTEFKDALREYYHRLPRGHAVEQIRERMRVERLMSDVGRMTRQIGSEVGLEGWVRDNDAGPLVLKPITVNEYGDQVVWRHGERWLCMSATIISAQELSRSLGVDEDGGKRWGLVTVPMTFPIENRRIVVAPVADMSKKGKENGEWEFCATAIARLIDQHPGERILIHTVSYELAGFLRQRLNGAMQDGSMGRRKIVSHTNAGDRDRALADFRRFDSSVLLSPSMDRGVDLRGEECRVVIVAKVPYPYLGDRQISERMHMAGGQEWYNVQTARSLVQMTGRAVRSEDDWAVSYVLDRGFVGNFWKRNKMLLPGWWREAVDMKGGRVRELVG
jgi:Rad3-related DNA helicase